MIFISRQTVKITGKPPNVYSGFTWQQIGFVEDDSEINSIISEFTNRHKATKAKYMIEVNNPEFEPVFIPSSDW